MNRIGKTQRTRQILLLVVVLSIVGCSQAPPPEAESQAGTAGAPVAEPSVVRGAIQFVEGYAKGYAAAKKADRPMLLFFTFDGCTYCHQMEQDAFVDEAVSDLAKRFVCVLVDADVEPEVCEKFDIRGFPTIQFMTSHGVPLNRLMGRRSADQLAAQMEAALEAAAVRAQHTGQSIVR